MPEFLAATFKASTELEVRQKGGPVAIRRESGPRGPNRPFTDTVTLGYVRDYDSNELIGTITQGDQKAVVLVDSLADILPVLDTDKLITDLEIVDGAVVLDDDGHVKGRESTIKNVKRRRVGTTLIALDIQTTG
jgi:hypothetical protein